VARRIRQENLLKDLYRLGEQREGRFQAPVSWPELTALRGHRGRSLAALARSLAGRGLVAGGGGGVRLTDEGVRAAEAVVRRHRLWEVYLTRRLELPLDHVHRDAEVMEHALSEEAVDRLEEALGRPEVDPHGRPIPPRRPLPAGKAA
jgi:manganese/zinc/iron transport system permease protein